MSHAFYTDRIHVIDSLPNIWMLDGRIITCKYGVLSVKYKNTIMYLM